MNRLDERMCIKYFVQYLLRRNYCLLSDEDNKAWMKQTLQVKRLRISDNWGKEET